MDIQVNGNLGQEYTYKIPLNGNLATGNIESSSSNQGVKEAKTTSKPKHKGIFSRKGEKLADGNRVDKALQLLKENATNLANAVHKDFGRYIRSQGDTDPVRKKIQIGCDMLAAKVQEIVNSKSTKSERDLEQRIADARNHTLKAVDGMIQDMISRGEIKEAPASVGRRTDNLLEGLGFDLNNPVDNFVATYANTLQVQYRKDLNNPIIRSAAVDAIKAWRLFLTNEVAKSGKTNQDDITKVMKDVQRREKSKEENGDGSGVLFALNSRIRSAVASEKVKLSKATNENVDPNSNAGVDINQDDFAWVDE